MLAHHQPQFSRKRLNSLCLSAFGLLFSCHVHALDLMQAYELALVRDPVFQSATLDYQAGLEDASIGRASLLPKLVANYNKATNRTTISGTQNFAGAPIGGYSYNSNYPSDYAALQLTQPLFSLDALARSRQGAAQADFSRSKFAYLTLDLSMRVLQAYTDLLYAMDHLRFQEAESLAFEEQAKVSAKMNQKGEAPITDTLQAQATAQVSRAKVIEAVDELENAKRKLESILGEPITDLRKVAKLQDKFSFLLVEPTTFEEWKERALANNAELAAMKNQVEVAKQEYAKNHGAHYPVVNLVAAATAQTSNTTATINQVANQSYAGFQVNLPLYAGGEINARSNQAYLNYQKTQSDYDVAKERVITELRKQYDLTRSGRLKIQALTEAKESSIKLVDAMRKSVRSGERINLDVLTADRTLFNSQQDLSQAKYVYLIAYIKLYQLGGSFDLTTLQKVASYFK